PRRAVARQAAALHLRRRGSAVGGAPARGSAAVQHGAPRHLGGRVPPAHRPITGELTVTVSPVSSAAPYCCTGRVLPGWRAALLVAEGRWTWYRRNWRGTVISSLLQPLLFLVAFGVGFGALVDAGGGAVRATGGLPYLVYLAPALLAVSAVQTATF